MNLLCLRIFFYFYFFYFYFLCCIRRGLRVWGVLGLASAFMESAFLFFFLHLLLLAGVFFSFLFFFYSFSTCHQHLYYDLLLCIIKRGKRAVLGEPTAFWKQMDSGGARLQDSREGK